MEVGDRVKLNAFMEDKRSVIEVKGEKTLITIEMIKISINFFKISIYSEFKDKKELKERGKKV